MVQDMKNEKLEKRVNKSVLQAADIFDFERLQKRNASLLDCEIIEEKETVLFCYNISEYRSLDGLREEDLLVRYAALTDIAGLCELRKEFDFPLCPENLYYDINAKVRVQERDVQTEDEEAVEAEFVQEYKAVVGAMLQKRYRYEDYIQGGLKLLKRNSFLSQIYGMQTVDEIKEFLYEHYYEEKQKRERNYCMVNKQKHRAQIAWGSMMTIVAALLGVAFFYIYFVEMPRMEAVISAHQDYYSSDYIAVIDDLKEQSTQDMNIYSKCILAISYVKSENLTAEQKENILGRINVNGNEKYICYWIELGRGNVAEAENIAMQLSDDELLLYAYMKERSQLESDESVDGSEKAARLEELQRKIDELAEKYSE